MIKSFILSILNKFGYRLLKTTDNYSEFYKIEKDFVEIYHQCKNYTMTSIERMYALYKATEYVVQSEIPGDIVECGVWKGGSAMVIAHTLNKLNNQDKKIYLYDTYKGMTKPTSKDIDIEGNQTIDTWEVSQKLDYNEWAYCSLQEVRNNILSTNYPHNNFLFIEGKVEDTIPNIIPHSISILRLDTDWYESTYHELYHLFPKLAVGGVIIVDDYGCFQGCKEATDQYFLENKIDILLNRIDNTGRIGVKLK